MVMHRQGPSPWLEAHGIIPQDVHAQLTLQNSTNREIKQLPCQDVGCKRCDEGR